MKNIGFIGTGVMGASMARNLMKNSYSLTVYTRTKSKAQPLIDDGGTWADTAAVCTANADAVITMLGYPKDVNDVYFGADGILSAARAGTYLIDMTTTSPKLSVKIYNAALEKGVFSLDAPVSGGDVGAKNASLSIMAGGDKAAFDACIPLFSAMGKNIVYEGPAGFGQHTKMANQIALSGVIASLCEALAYGRAAGLNLQTMLDSIGAGAAGSWQMANMSPKILSGNDNPGFYIKHFIKDMNIALEEAGENGLNLDVLHVVRDMYQKLESQQMGEFGTQALIHYYDKK